MDLDLVLFETSLNLRAMYNVNKKNKWLYDKSTNAVQRINTRINVKRIVSRKMEENQGRRRQETVIDMEEVPRQRQRNFDQQNEEGDLLETDMRQIRSSAWGLFVTMLFLWLFCVLLLIGKTLLYLNTENKNEEKAWKCYRNIEDTRWKILFHVQKKLYNSRKKLYNKTMYEFFFNKSTSIYLIPVQASSTADQTQHKSYSKYTRKYQFLYSS